jgi:Flp pilus assembly protein TadB
MTTKSLKLFALTLLLAVVVVYKIAWPWTPWWVDLCVAVLALILVPWKNKSGETEKSGSNSD